jgi:hypothetical protein
MGILGVRTEQPSRPGQARLDAGIPRTIRSAGPTAGQLMAEERDTRSEIGTPRAQDSARLMTAPVRLRGPDTTGTRAAVGLSK